MATGAAPLPLTAVEYFAGIGLFRMGLEAAGWQVIYANDWNPKRAQIYEGFFGERFQVQDIFAVDPQDVPQATLATCSFPCIDLSLAGKGSGINGSHSGAFWGFCGMLRKQGRRAPKIALLENVNGWLYSNGGDDFYETAKALNELGYACDAFALDARRFTPHSRPRIFMVGMKSDAQAQDGAGASISDASISKFGAPRSKRLTTARLDSLMRADSGIRWTRLDIPEPPPLRRGGFSDAIAERLAPDDPRWWGEEKVAKHIAMMSPPHLARARDMARRDSESFRTFFRRRRADGQRAEVRRDDIAGCLRTASGGSGKQFLVAAGNGKIRTRALTARECARLQGVPDEFPIAADTERQAIDAFGDAVCVPVVEWIAARVLRPLADSLSETS